MIDAAQAFNRIVVSLEMSGKPRASEVCYTGVTFSFLLLWETRLKSLNLLVSAVGIEPTTL
jgi:hypothetical protein